MNALEFREAPELLAVRFPPFQDTTDGSRFWLANCYNAKWGDDELSLAECYGAEIQGPNLGRYRIVSYVEYVVTDDFSMPTAVIKSGHFVANFREGDVWYRADDSVLSVVEPSQPMAFSYLCIFERVGLSRHEPCVSKQLLATESGYSESCGMPAPKRRRLHVKAKVD